MLTGYLTTEFVLEPENFQADLGVFVEPVVVIELRNESGLPIEPEILAEADEIVASSQGLVWVE